MPFLLCQPFCTHRNTSSDLYISSIILRVRLVSARQGCSCAKLNDKGGIGEEEQSVCLHEAHSDSEALPVQAERLLEHSERLLPVFGASYSGRNLTGDQFTFPPHVSAHRCTRHVPRVILSPRLFPSVLFFLPPKIPSPLFPLADSCLGLAQTQTRL